MEKIESSFDLAGKKLTLETGRLAKQATSSVLARLGDTTVLVTIVMGNERPDLGYFPLSVEYIERLYAGGRIKGSRWVKREGRPSDDAILTARLIDRSIRPLFPKEFSREVQIIVTVLSVDGENEPDILSIIAVSAALHSSPIPWNGPVSAIRMGYVKEASNGGFEHIVNPGSAEISLSELDMVITQTKEKTLMLEAGAAQLEEEHVLQAIEKAHEQNNEVIKFIEDFAKKIGKEKIEVTKNAALMEMVDKIAKSYKTEIGAVIKARATKEAGGGSEDLVSKIFDDLSLAKTAEAAPIDKKLISKAVEYLSFKLIRENVLKKKERPDGRKIDEVRPINVDVSILPRTHGSAIFQRGDTQALTVATLGSPRLEQLIESAEGEESKRYIHHYSMPPYSVGETGRIGVPSRREIGHGALAERAILSVIPKQEVFPYTIRVVSEILSSNGSTSMAATCGSTLALMDAGVPILAPVAGIAMGMMSDTSVKDGDYVILTDIIGLEDFSGDMDFKVAGTGKGVTAIQLDVKIPGLTDKQVKEIFERAKVGRMTILDKMLTVIQSSRSQVSEFAPKIELIKIPVEKIGEVIGSGGRTIKNIIATTGATVDVEDDGSVTVSGTNQEAVTKAAEWVKALTREVLAGEEFEGEVKRILPFGAFVEILPGKEGMVHVSQMSTEFVKNPTDVVQIGQKVKVRVMEIDEQGRINLSMLFGEDANKKVQQRSERQDFRPQRENPHPLSMQFRRERMGKQSQSPRRGFRPRKPSY